MKEQLPDYYALLQVSPGACQSDVINGYRHARQAYQQDSLAAYTLYSAEELEGIQAQIEEAYRTLSDPERRRSYDILYRNHTRNPMRKWPEDGNVVSLGRSEEPRNAEETDEDIAGTEDTCSGAALRRARTAKGVSLEFIADHTKISKRYLHAIEDEHVEHFPEVPYLKGYIRQYCAEIGMDAEPVVAYFMALLEPSH